MLSRGQFDEIEHAYILCIKQGIKRLDRDFTTQDKNPIHVKVYSVGSDLVRIDIQEKPCQLPKT